MTGTNNFSDFTLMASVFPLIEIVKKGSLRISEISSLESATLTFYQIKISQPQK